jgi:hypothetical protein
MNFGRAGRRIEKQVMAILDNPDAYTPEQVAAAQRYAAAVARVDETFVALKRAAH